LRDDESETLAILKGMIDADEEPKEISFEQAIEDTADLTRYLLLGNGFSISARNTFSYSSLFRRAGGLSDPVAALFRDLETEDFERVLHVLKSKLENTDKEPAEYRELKIQEDEVRKAFIGAIQGVHPDNAAMMGHDECERCISVFLSHFVGKSRPQTKLGRIYTTNYDLLLYWVLARSGKRLRCYDSHISPLDERRWGLWVPEKPPGLVYLHGALHLYQRGGGGQAMLRYDGQHSLITQAKARLDKGSFPVIVAEGTSEDKAARIARSGYLSWGLNYARTGLRNREGALFTYGHSLDDRDAHILKHVGSGRIKAVYIGAFGGLQANMVSVQRWTERWRASRAEGPELKVFVYDTALFSPWK
jgi:hypothetical protein